MNIPACDDCGGALRLFAYTTPGFLGQDYFSAWEVYTPAELADRDYEGLVWAASRDDVLNWQTDYRPRQCEIRLTSAADVPADYDATPRDQPRINAAMAEVMAAILQQP